MGDGSRLQVVFPYITQPHASVNTERWRHREATASHEQRAVAAVPRHGGWSTTRQPDSSVCYRILSATRPRLHAGGFWPGSLDLKARCVPVANAVARDAR